jgi:membrane-bound inhibitor of C-type lysozyme
MTHPALAAAVATAFAVLAGPAFAQNAPAKPAAKPAAKVAKAAPAAAVAAAPVVLAAASPEQIEAAERTHYGAYACEFGQTVDVGISPRGSGYVDVKYKNSVFTMKPVVSSTGALRLEDVTGRTLMLQIANKSMLMDTRIGQRLVDDCVHPEQAKFNAARTN